MTDFDTSVEASAEPLAVEATDAAPISVRDSIEAAFDKAESGTDDVGQPRDPMGRFAAKQAEEAAAAAAKFDTASVVDPAAPVAPVNDMPSSWGRDKAELWAKTPPEVRAYIAQREQQVSEGFKQYEGLAEFAELAQSNGGSLRATLTTVRELDNLVTSDPVRGFETIMSRIGFDPAKVARAYLGIQPDGSVVERPAAPQIDPSIQRTIEELQQQVQTMRIQPFQQQVDAFASDPANKHFDRLIGPIQAIIASEKGLSLKDAYDRACWADPQVRAELLQAQQGAVAKAQQLTKSTQTAERASRGLSPSSNADTPINGNRRQMSARESIEAAFAAHS